MMQRFQQTAGKTVLTYGTKLCALVGGGLEKLVVEENVIRRLIHAPNQHSQNSTRVDYYPQEEYLATQYGYRNAQSPSVYFDTKDTEQLTYPIGSNLDILSSPEVQKILASKVRNSSNNVTQSGSKNIKR